ncbi:hypothetical protein RLOatenuis_3000 [Rickettsiales bacterium]|nr:hypothetical protein RLOatenuis_3000 [Rickettsiales bacterium]
MIIVIQRELMYIDEIKKLVLMCLKLRSNCALCIKITMAQNANEKVQNVFRRTIVHMEKASDKFR